MDSKGSELWEVRAFAEDTNRCGAQWPPRSYSCSFCKRQFRTAQALGGHMNVHRRERALVNKLAVPRSATDYVTHCSLVSTGPNVGCNCKANAASPSVEYLSKPPSSSSSPPPPTTFSQAPGISAPKSMSQSTCVTGITNTGSRLSISPPSQVSISSASCKTMQDLSKEAMVQRNPDFLCEHLSQHAAMASSRAFHPYGKSWCKPTPKVNLRRFSLHLNNVMGEAEDKLDLELRLGQGSCTV